MNWIKNFVRPKIRSILGVKRDVPENMWIKDPDSGQMVFYRDLEANQFVFPGSDHHHRLAAALSNPRAGQRWRRGTEPDLLHRAQ